MSLTIGIDEAGRGPVLGPLVIGAVVWDERRDWPGPRVDDSKQLSASHRGEVAEVLRHWTMVRVQHIPAWVIDRSTHSLPYLEALVIRGLLNELPPVSVHCDALSSGERIHSFLEDAFPEQDLRFWAGADADDEAVGAASIVAKHSRDAALERIGSTHGEVGSGYPGDPTTRSWIEERVETRDWPPFVRTSWSTVPETVSPERDSDLFPATE